MGHAVQVIVRSLCSNRLQSVLAKFEPMNWPFLDFCCCRSSSIDCSGKEVDDSWLVSLLLQCCFNVGFVIIAFQSVSPELMVCDNMMCTSHPPNLSHVEERNSAFSAIKCTALDLGSCLPRAIPGRIQ